MDKLHQKLSVLSKIAHVLNKNQVLWAVGGSMLLYFKGKANDFHDIDLMVGEEDVEKVRKLLSSIGELLPEHPDVQYKTRHFLEFSIEGVDVDVMAGFIIVKDGREFDCSLFAEQIVDQIWLDEENIPLQSLSDWRRYYELMGRMSKVAMIDA